MTANEHPMLRRGIHDLRNAITDIDLISTDVFDTLLLRTGNSERSRILAAEKSFAKLLADHGLTVGAEELVQARSQAQKFAYRALNVGGRPGEVRLIDIIRRQLAILGLPAAMANERLTIEIEGEKRSLAANRPLAMLLRRQRKAGRRIVAISDTGLPTDRVQELIDYFHGPGLIDRVYSSADQGGSKRHGDLFSIVLAAEGVSPGKMLHIGDDAKADLRVPEAKGINSIHIPVSPLKRFASRADGAATEVAKRMSRRGRWQRQNLVIADNRVAFGEAVFGPIVAQFCLYIWLYVEQASVNNDAALLFCARGGVGIREAFEGVVRTLGLPLSLPRENILISRLVAARAAVLTRSPAVLDELAREFRGATFAEVASSLGGKRYDLPDDWQRIFDPVNFFSLLDTNAGADVLNDICQQNELFTRHLDAISGGAKRIILCDTGLYGSTQRLLAAGFPDRNFETIQFARCNYKGLSEDHFSKVAGLVVEQNLYNPLKVETVVLRYWQIIESLFEPKVSSVNFFKEDENGEIVSNAGDVRYGVLDPSAGNLLLDGALQYIKRTTSGSQVLTDAVEAWSTLKTSITQPNRNDLGLLGVGSRSVDFGRSDLVQIINDRANSDVFTRLKFVKSNLWREGAIARDFELLRSPLLTTLEMSHVFRSVLSWSRRSTPQSQG